MSNYISPRSRDTYKAFEALESRRNNTNDMNSDDVLEDLNTEESSNKSIFTDDETSLNNSSKTAQHLDRSRSQPPSTKSQETANNQGISKTTMIILAIILTIIAVVFGITNAYNLTGIVCNETLHHDFFAPETKLTIETAVAEIKQFDRPSVLTFIYDKKSEEEVDRTIKKILNFATCALNGRKEFVEVTRTDVTSPEIIADKGKLITKYKAKLEEHNVMLVKHLENVPGDVAMVFHFLCDQYTPVVHRALIIFTLQYNEEMKSLSEFDIVENVLTTQWNELKADMIPPLIARLSNAIVKV